MALPATVQAALTRLASFYNGGVRVPEGQPSANPGGFDGDGHSINFVPALRDVATAGQGMGAYLEDVVAEAEESFGQIGETIGAKADRFERAVAAIEAGPVTSVNGMSGAVVLPEVPKVLPPIVTAPAQGTTASLNAGALLLAVDRLTSLYGEAQKTIRFQIASADSFDAGAIVHDTGVLTQSAVSVSVPDAQSKLTANTTYYVRAIQTDAKDVSSGWSAPVSFVFPRPPSARAMSAPASGATNVGAQNAPITLTAAAYSHPDGVAQAARRFELSTTSNFAVIITVPGVAGQASASIANPKATLAANTLYRVRCVDTDANGLVTRGAAITFTTASVFRTEPGEADSGGFKAFNDFGDGDLFDLIVAPKSTEVSRVWSQGSSNTPLSFSRMNGPGATDAIVAAGSTFPAGNYARSVSIGGAPGYLGAIDELRAISSKLKPSAAPSGSLFVTGGSEILADGGSWSSTETSSSNSLLLAMRDGTEAVQAKTFSLISRAIKRLVVTPPIAHGTYVAEQGGWLWFYFTDASSVSPITYAVFKADKAVEVTRAWDTTSSPNATGRSSRIAGPSNSSNIASSTHLAALYCEHLVHGGKDDWYLGAIDEMLAGARMNDRLPAAQRLTVDAYWSSTEIDANNALQLRNNISPVSEGSSGKASMRFVIPIRRVPLTSLAA